MQLMLYPSVDIHRGVVGICSRWSAGEIKNHLMSNNLIPVARLIKPWAGLSKTETAAQGFCEVPRAKLMKQKLCMLAWDLLHWSLLRAYFTEVLSRKAGPAPSAAQLSTSQCLAPILGTFANCLVYIYTLP